jgi:hypothetical protein
MHAIKHVRICFTEFLQKIIEKFLLVNKLIIHPQINK